VGGSLNPLNAELNPICHLLALLGAHLIFHVSRIRVNISDTKHASRLCCGYSVFTICGTHNVISHKKTFRTFTLALCLVCAQRSRFIFFCSSLISYFPCTLFRYCVNDFEVALIAPIIIGYDFCFHIPHTLCVCIVTS
jgi:hypothetical protein